MKKIDKLKEVPVIGETYLVPCFVDNWRGGFGLNNKWNSRPTVIPVYNLPHHDVENGQHSVHYHTDSRFEDDENFAKVNLSFVGGRVFQNTKHKKKIHYFPLKYITHEERMITPNNLIAKSKVKGCRVVNNRCPHRGFDLTAVPADRWGNRHCPLHGTIVNKNGIAS